MGWSECAGIGWLGGQVEVLKDGAAGVAGKEHGEDAHRAAAGVADKDVDREHALHERSPGEPTEWAGVTP